jgi:hypothetical protein
VCNHLFELFDDHLLLLPDEKDVLVPQMEKVKSDATDNYLHLSGHDIPSLLIKQLSVHVYQ